MGTLQNERFLLNCYNLRLVPKIPYAACLGLFPAISAQCIF